MKYFFCTYFDQNYLDRGLALYLSLVAHCSDFRLFVLCLDDRCYTIIRGLALEGIEPIRLSELETWDEELLRSKSTRSVIEYYFTLTPAFLLYTLETFDALDHITYLDADLFFFSEPAPVFAEIGQAAIGIVPHRYGARNQKKVDKFGTFNVAFNYFKRGEEALECLRRWRAQCIEWCYDRPEEGRFADQKYLDEWPHRYFNLSVIQHEGANLAPWNIGNTPVAFASRSIYIGGQPLIFYHFHGLKKAGFRLYDPCTRIYGNRLSPLAKDNIYEPYLTILEELEPRIASMVNKVSLRYAVFGQRPRPPFWKIAWQCADKVVCTLFLLLSRNFIWYRGHRLR